MAFHVVIHHRVPPDNVGPLLATIRHGFTASRTLHPERRSARVFQRLGDPTQLLALSEWAGEEAFERFRRSSAFVEAVARTGTEPRIEPLALLRRFERVAQRSGFIACSTITATTEAIDGVLDYLLDEAQRAATSAEGLVGRDLYRSRADANRVLLVHCWRSLDDLERFRARFSAGAELRRLGATAERFTGTLAAELALYDR